MRGLANPQQQQQSPQSRRGAKTQWDKLASVRCLLWASPHGESSRASFLHPHSSPVSRVFSGVSIPTTRKLGHRETDPQPVSKATRSSPREAEAHHHPSTSVLVPCFPIKPNYPPGSRSWFLIVFSNKRN